MELAYKFRDEGDVMIWLFTIRAPLLAYIQFMELAHTPVLSWSIHRHSFIGPPYFIGVPSELLLTNLPALVRV